jgi:aspartate/tyrosine/aromatic aminotransferase
MAIPDHLFNIQDGYRKDTNPKKVNLGIGAYRDNDGIPYVFPVV